MIPVLAAALALPAAAAEKPHTIPQDASKRVGELFADREGKPGTAVVVVHRGRVLHSAGYGLSNLEKREPITPKTVFDLGSVSKQFNALAIMLLAERGKLSYDDPLTKFFPEFPGSARGITVRHLLQHTSGLDDYMELFVEKGKIGKPEEWEKAKPTYEPTSHDTLMLLAGHDKMRFQPGEKWEYSNSGYAVLGQIVEKASGMRYAQFLHENIFKPLGMEQTLVYDETRPAIPLRAISYQCKSECRNIDYTPLNLIYGDGNVNSSAADMTHWATALGNRLARTESWKLAWTPGRLNSGKAHEYGLGWRIDQEDGVLKRVSHAGSWVGFRAYIEHHPSEQFTVVLLSNYAEAQKQNIDRAGKIVEIYLGKR